MRFDEAAHETLAKNSMRARIRSLTAFELDYICASQHRTAKAVRFWVWVLYCWPFDNAPWSILTSVIDEMRECSSDSDTDTPQQRYRRRVRLQKAAARARKKNKEGLTCEST